MMAMAMEREVREVVNRRCDLEHDFVTGFGRPVRV